MHRIHACHSVETTIEILKLTTVHYGAGVISTSTHLQYAVTCIWITPTNQGTKQWIASCKIGCICISPVLYCNVMNNSLEPSNSRSMPSRTVLEQKGSALSAPQTTFTTSFFPKLFGEVIFGRRHCWPAVADSPKTLHSRHN